jgi:tetratricopeptide (TPR) repeat protein
VIGSASAAVALSCCYWKCFDSKRALEDLKFALPTLKAFSCPEDIAYGLSIMFECNFALANLFECRYICQEGLKLSKKAGMDFRTCEFSIHYARYYTRLEHYDKALESCREALALSEALGCSLWHTRILEMIGYALAMKKEYEGARLAYERVRTEYSNMEGIEGIRVLKRLVVQCEHNISEIDRAKRGEEGPKFKS